VTQNVAVRINITGVLIKYCDQWNWLSYRI